jgi:dTDP-4-dehydrorhamnose reductase
VAYASSHHVFAGDDPPYREDDPPAPLSVYGHTKLAGERHVLGVPGSLVVRLPALYSLDPDAPNGKILDLGRAIETGRPVQADAAHLRYYTLAEEVATAFAFLMSTDRRGVVNVSAARGCTEAEFARAAARAMGLDSDLVVERGEADSPVTRPRDSRLDTSLYESLGGPSMTDYDAVLRTHARSMV